jgi:1-phosphatidylinositol-3-phosphate 5-kinase
LTSHSSSGQIFCSRCASNIIKGSRFGHNGLVRVCNLCLEKLAKVDEDDDDDRRSIASGISFPAHQMGAERHDHLFGSLGQHPQSPFAASQLFGRQDEPFNLFSIAETKRFSHSQDSFPGLPPLKTVNDKEIADALTNAAPFRRGIGEDRKDSDVLGDPFNTDHSPTVLGSKTAIDFPITVPVAPDGSISSVKFPIGSPEKAEFYQRSRVNSTVDTDLPTPFLRSRVQSRLDSLVMGEAGWRTRRESTACVAAGGSFELS